MVYFLDKLYKAHKEYCYNLIQSHVTNIFSQKITITSLKLAIISYRLPWYQHKQYSKFSLQINLLTQVMQVLDEYYQFARESVIPDKRRVANLMNY